GGQLTEAVRRKPFSVVLFDEIEKAHPDVFNTLLQILEDGRLTDAQGRSVDFKNTVIIMTSNLGTADLRKASIGFARADEAVTYEKMKEKVHEELKRHFRPEFLNRIDDVIVFHQLSTEEITEIVDLLIRRLQTQLESQGLAFELTQDAKFLLARKGYDASLGARPLRRAIQRMVEDPLSEKILWKEFHAGDTIVADAEADEIVFRTHAEAVQRLTSQGSLTSAVPLDDLRNAGWRVSAWKRDRSGGAAITLSHGFVSQVDLARRLADLTGPNGALRDPRITRTRGWFGA